MGILCNPVLLKVKHEISINAEENKEEMAGGGTASYLLPIVTILIHILFPPFLIILGITIILASFGKSLGIRKLYVKALIRIFDFTRKIATEAQHDKIRQQSTEINTHKSSFQVESDSNSSSDEDDTPPKACGQQINSKLKVDDCDINNGQISSSAQVGYDESNGLTLDQTNLANSTLENFTKRNGNIAGAQGHNPLNTSFDPHELECDNVSSLSTDADSLKLKSNDVAFLRQRLRGMGRESRHNVISRRDNLMLSPDQQPGAKNGIIKSVHEEVDEDQYSNVTQELISNEQNVLLNPTIAGDSLQREFELDDVYPYIKTGIASIIEDEVTQRFVAEELKSWNLLTRTSQSFEFVNIRLTIIWIAGFIFRYCLLLPGRTFILFVGVSLSCNDN